MGSLGWINQPCQLPSSNGTDSNDAGGYGPGTNHAGIDNYRAQCLGFHAACKGHERAISRATANHQPVAVAAGQRRGTNAGADWL